MKALITGFDPFGEETINPATEIIMGLPNYIAGCEIVTAKIPTVFNKSLEVLEELIEHNKPDFVICIGQAGGAYGISVERVAINLNEARIPDNDGQQPLDETIIEDGQNAYFSNIPVKAIVQTMKEMDIPAKVSYTAGTFVCNHLLYGLLYLIDTKYQNLRGGFIHVPFLSKQVIGKGDKAFMPLDMMIQAIMIAIETSVKYKKDITLNYGELY